jgi:death-on-curing protein
MISLHETEALHKVLIEKFGGTIGLRDTGSLQSALSRPFQTFNNVDLYPSVLEKAAALIESIINNHPFIDGNKRTGYVITLLLLMSNGYDVRASQDVKYEFVIDIASGKMKFQEILNWLQIHSIFQPGA